EIRPIAQAETLASDWYTTTEALELDRRILESSWQYVGHHSEIPEKGSFLVAEILGEPLVVVRNQTGIQAFYNVCRHRAGPLATANGKARVLRCGCHAWTYDLEGNLIGTPRFDGDEDFDRRCYGLQRVRTEV